MIVVVVLISSWYWASRNAWRLPLDTMRITPCTSQTMTSSKQNAKNGARLASLAASPANLSKNPTLLETSLGMRRGADFSVMMTPSCGRHRRRYPVESSRISQTSTKVMRT